MTFFIVETQYVGPNRREDRFVDAHRIEIRTAPARSNTTSQPCTDGWCGTTNDWAVYAHGEYPTIEAAREAIEAQFGPCREDEGVSPADDVVETYRPGRYEPYGRDTTRSWCYESVLAEVTANTTPDQIDALIASLEESAQITAGATLDLDEVRAVIEERLAELRT